MDAPFQLLPDLDLPVYVFVKDADLFPVMIRSLELRLWDESGNSRRWQQDLDWRCERNLETREFALSRREFQGMLRVDARIRVELAGGGAFEVRNHNYRGVDPSPLEIRLLEHPLPYPENWRAGEMHCHSEFSSDPVEFGAPLALMQKTARAVGLDFVLCTDHSYDFYYRRESYLDPCDPAENFRSYREQALALNAASPSLPVLVPGEEVSCGNGRGENVHLLVFGHESFLPGLGDGGRRGFRNRPDLSIPEVLDRLGGTPAFAAHPKARIGWLERKVFRRGAWDESDVAPEPSGSLRGLQFWNGHIGADYREGKSFWVQSLLAGRRLLPIGANDAHGDFNRNIGVKVPLFSLYHSRNHLFGNVRTVVPSPRQDPAALRAAFAGDTCVCTDGPFVTLKRETAGLRLRVQSNSDFGALSHVCLYGATAGAATETLLRAWEFDAGPLSLEEPFPTPASGYLRAEVQTRTGKRALTSAFFADSVG